MTAGTSILIHPDYPLHRRYRLDPWPIDSIDPTGSLREILDNDLCWSAIMACGVPCKLHFGAFRVSHVGWKLRWSGLERLPESAGGFRLEIQHDTDD